MCGRYTLAKDGRRVREELAGFFSETQIVPKLPDLRLFDELRPRYNVAPTQNILTLLLRDGDVEAVLLKWGLIPAWAKDPRPKPIINARAETIASKPSFRSAFRSRRCLVPADGWYEWREEGGRKQPYHFHLPGRALFLFAGIWERWSSPAGEAVDTVSLITTEPNAVAARVHDRMPVILTGVGVDAWLDPAAESDALQSLLRPYGGEMECYAVSPAVNRAQNDGPECVEPLL